MGGLSGNKMGTSCIFYFRETFITVFTTRMQYCLSFASWGEGEFSEVPLGFHPYDSSYAIHRGANMRILPTTNVSIQIIYSVIGKISSRWICETG